MPEDLRPGRFDVLEHLPADRRDPGQDDPSILGTLIRSTKPRSSTRSMSPVAAESDTSSISASRLIGDLAVTLEEMHDVQLGHADAETDESLAADALEFSERGAQVGQDRRLRLVGGHASYHANYHSLANDTVNVNNR